MKAQATPLIVTVFGSAEPLEGQPAYEQARRLGRAIAAAGWTLCNGGYGGTMEASARGATEAGGHTIGVTCRAFEGRAAANAFIREEISTASLFDRLRRLIEPAAGFFVLPGGSGTLVELALVLEMSNKRLLKPIPPIIVIGDSWYPVISRILTPVQTCVRLEFTQEIDDAASRMLQHIEHSMP